ncbi:Stk1 family PASTA domain-containing Ser/Thr kinase [Arthrobacter psychrochitiniphilus]|uniref:non-specific serine/threonine protein kinase n=1 Tax=Arthrobacter psychrochitiniphilus TaxID=291045 RepID=A0A2V3DRP7_9MICC|nr:Stk1 family PASTA domain-containing Ser/Thr kinase [Arthrobacter psychrochitiniphilus]NYG19243.1 serine/threonine-protein kinase [Arthrobacter psychrochitiniphilus]PXA65820.1 Stk1 family PASTA domain-containing Ser/Thr kinase [Arthrobacter psychrochitiniphilus]
MSIPRVLNDRYEIGELLGRGGMADVYKAQDTRLGRTVAIKLLRADVARDSQLQARFRREAQAVAGLNYPAIVAVYDTGEHISSDHPGDGAHVPYIVMEYVHGKTLRDLIRAKAITTEQALKYGMGVLSALDYSHRAGIVHRDIKPANVMVTEDENGVLGVVKVMDFGIARTISDSAATMTQTQTVMGTAQYLSPEQARGESVDARSDLYSAACLLYEMLAGRPPFTGDSPVSVAYQHVRERPPVPSTFNPDLTPALDALLMRALQKDRRQRFQDATSFRRALRAAVAGVAPPPGQRESHVDGNETTVIAAVSEPQKLMPAPAIDAGGPSTRAMAKELAGGALTTNGGVPEDTDNLYPSVKRRRRAWMVTLFVVLALMLGGGAMVGYNMINAVPAAVAKESIPPLSGMTLDEATVKLEALGMSPHSAEEFSSVTKGEVIRTDPPSGTLVELNTTVEIFVSKGPSEVQIPKDISGLTEPQVRQELLDLGLLISSSDLVNDGSINANLVVTTDPAPGQSVPVGTRVALKISNGQVLMPSLFDLTKDPKKVKQAVTEALKKVSEYLEVTFEESENSVVTPGMVTGQSIQSGTSVAQRTSVVVTLAKKPTPKEPNASQEPSPGEQPPETTAPPSPKP